MGLENIVSFKFGRAVCYDELAVLTTRLFHVSEASVCWVKEHTKTIPDPQDPDHAPPVKEIQFRCPRGVGPTEMRGLRVTDIRKSRLSEG
jgi:hypothetical protein